MNQPLKLASINRNKSFKDRLDPLLCKYCTTSVEPKNADYHRSAMRKLNIYFVDGLLWTKVQIPSLYKLYSWSVSQSDTARTMFNKKTKGSSVKKSKCMLFDGIARMLKCCNTGVFRLGFLFRKSFNRWYRQAKYCAFFCGIGVQF